MITNVLDGIEVMDAALGLQAAAGGNAEALKRLLRRAEGHCQTDAGRDLLRLIRMKLTQLEDQIDGTG